MAFKNNIPISTNNLARQSQQDLLNNNIQLDTSFGTDHYPFSDLTASNGFHNKVTTPGYVTVPPTVPVVQPTTTTNPVFYGFQALNAGGVATNNLGLLQFSRGPSNAVPSPVTSLHSGATPIVLAGLATTNVLNFTGLPKAFVTLYAMDTTQFTSAFLVSADVYWNGTSLIIINNGGSSLTAIASLTILQVKNNSNVVLNNVYWTLKLHRVE